MSFTSDYKSRLGLPMNRKQKKDAEKSGAQITTGYDSASTKRLMSGGGQQQEVKTTGFKEWSAFTLAAQRAQKIRESAQSPTIPLRPEVRAQQMNGQTETQIPLFSSQGATAPTRFEGGTRGGTARDDSPFSNFDLGKFVAGLGEQGVTTAAKGVADTLAFLEGLVTKPIDYVFTGGKSTPLTDSGLFRQIQKDITKEQEAAANKYAANVQKGGTVAKVTNDLGVATVAAVPQAVLAMLSGGASTGLQASNAGKGLLSTVGNVVNKAGKNPAFWSSFMQMTGSEYEDAKARGASEMAATLEALAAGTINALVEVGGGIETLPSELQTGQFTVRKWIESMVDEGKEEVVQGIVSRGLQTLAAQDDAPIFGISDPDAVFNPMTAAQEFAGGVVVGGILGGAQGLTVKLINGAATKAELTELGADIRSNEDGVNRLFQMAEYLPEDSAARKRMETLSKHKDTISDQDLGALYQAVVKETTARQEAVQKAVDKAATAPYNENVETEVATVLNQGATLYAQLGMKTKRAEAKATVVQKLVDGETVTNGELKSLNLSDPKYREIFTELTGIQFPQGKVTEEQLFNLARAAKGGPASAEVQAVTSPETAVAEVEQQAQDPQTRTAPATFEEYAQAYRARVDSEASDADIRKSYDRYARDMQTVRTANNGTLTRSEFKQIMRNSAQGSQYTDEQLDQVFDAALRQQEGNAEAGALFRAGDGLAQYKSSESYKLNAALREGTKLTPEQEQLVKELDDDLESMPVYTGPVSRTISFDLEGPEALQEFLRRYTPGNRVTEFAYTSATKDPNGYPVEGELLVRLELQSQTGRDVSDQFGLTEEQEVLLPRGAQLDVEQVSRKDGVYVITAREVTDDGGTEQGRENAPGSARSTNGALSGTAVGGGVLSDGGGRRTPNGENGQEGVLAGVSRSGSGQDTQVGGAVLRSVPETEAENSDLRGVPGGDPGENNGGILREVRGPAGRDAGAARGEVTAEAETDLARMQQMSWSDQVSNRDSLPENSALYLRETPYLLSEVGLGDLPMCMTVKHLNDVMHEKSAENTQWHGIDQDVIEHLPELISKPAMIMDSNSRRGDIMVVTTEVDAEGNPIVVSVRPNGVAMVGGVRGPANFITSVYGRENFAVKRGRNSLNNLMYLATKNRLVLYWNKEKTEALFRDTGLQLPGGLNSVPSNTILKQHAGYVKENIPERLFRVEEESDEVLLSDDSRGTGGVQEAGRGADGSVSERGLGDRIRPRRGNADDSAQHIREGTGTGEGQTGAGEGQPEAVSYPGGREDAGQAGERTSDREVAGSGGRNSGAQSNLRGTGRGDLGANQEGAESRVIPGAATSEATTADMQDGASFVLDLPDFKSWNDAFSYLNIRGGQALEFAEDLNPAITDEAEVGYSAPDGKWVKVQSFDLTLEGLAEFKRKLPTLLQAVNPQPRARPWADTVQTSKVAYPMRDGSTVEVTTVSAADAGLTKAEKDTRRVGMQLVPVLGSLPENRSTAGITIARTRQIFSVVEDPELGTNRRTADHEVLHAYALADHELQFQILDAVRDAGLDSEFDTLYNRAMNLWAGRYQEADPVTLRYQIEQEVMAEARAGNTNLLGRDIKKIGPTVRQTVRAWEKNWDKAHKEADSQNVQLRQPNAMDLALRYQQRGGFRDGTSDQDGDIDFSMFDETDAYDRYSLPQLVDPMYSKLAREVQNFKGEKIGAASAISYLKGKGVKAEEIKWSGIESFLDGKKSVTKEELLQYLRDNALRIETETLSGNRDFTEVEYVDQDTGELYEDFGVLKDAAYEAAVQMGLNSDRDEIRLSVSNDGSRVVASLVTPYGEKVLLVADRAKANDPARWSEYKLPYGEHYREILFKLPGADYTNDAMRVHWGRPGILAHARVQDMTAADGGKVLFVEEIQSDWHNAGQKNGYIPREQQAAIKQYLEYNEYMRNRRWTEEDRQVLDDLKKEAFPEYKAAQENYDLLWSQFNAPGAIRDLRDRIAEVAFQGNAEQAETYMLGLSADSTRDSLRWLANRHRIPPFEDSATEVLSDFITRWEAAEGKMRDAEELIFYAKVEGVPDAPFSKNYHEYVMKNLLREAAENGYDYVAWTTGKTQEDRWSSDYAEGYRIEYDQDIPKFMNKYGKQWGAKVEDIVVGGDLSRSGAFQDGGMAEVVRIASGMFFDNERYNVAHAVAVNDAMRDSVLYEGQPMFRVSETPEQAQFRTEYDAIYGEGAAADLLADVRGALAEASAQQPESESQVGWVMYGKKPEAQSVGAAALRFDPYSYLQNEYGTIPQTGTNYRVADVPKSTTGKDKVMKTASTVMGAEATPDARLGTVAQAVVDGKLSYVPITNKILNNQTRAKIRKQGYNAVLSDWTRQVEQGKVNARIVATGATLLNNAGNSDMDGRTYTELLVDYANVLHRAGQALQAARLLKTLSPEAKLYEVIREVDRVNRKAFPDSNVPVELWMDRAGGLLADKLMERISTKSGKDKARTVVDTILDDLYRRAGEMVEKSPAPARRARTEMERLQDMFDNYANYKEAWEAAKKTIRTEYADDPAVLEALDEWLNDSLKLAKPLTKELMRGVEVTMSEELAEKYLAAKSDAERDAVMDEILQDIADQVPATWGDKFTAWRYLAMLGNLRTQVRNIVGNTAMQPLRVTKETFSGLTEALLQRAGVKIDRTTSAFYDMATFKAAFQDYNEVRDVILSGGKYDDSRKYSAEIESKRRIFKNALLEGYRKATNTAMDVGDSIFCSFTYADSLARFMKANGTTWSQADEALKDKARAKAIRDAAEATYRDNNALSELVSRARIRDPKNALAKAAQVMIEGTLPFRKTPANILVRSYEYSPLGILDTAFKSAQLARGTGEVTANDIIDSASKALAGTSLVALGFAWAAMGVLKGKAPDDEKEKELWEMQGHQAYSLEIGGTSYTLDWLAPSSIPMFFGANLQEAMMAKGLTVEEATAAFGSLFDPILEMSMLQGINDTLESAANYGTVAAAVRLPANAAWNYLTQFVPTLAGQTARAMEPDRMTTYADKNNAIPDDLERKIGNLSGKIPGWDFARITYIDAWGRTEPNADTATLNALNQFFSPGYYSQVRETDMEKELLRLYETTGETSVLISKPSKYLTVNKERKDLTADEYLTYAVTRGQTAFSLATDLTGSAAYEKMSDAQKVKAVEKVYDYADQTAKEYLLGEDFVADKWVYNARSAAEELGVPVEMYLTAYTLLGDVSGVKDSKGDTVSGSKGLRSMQVLYDIPGLSEDQVRGLAARLGVAESVQGYSSKMVDRKLDALERKYSKYN